MGRVELIGILRRRTRGIITRCRGSAAGVEEAVNVLERVPDLAEARRIIGRRLGELVDEAASGSRDADRRLAGLRGAAWAIDEAQGKEGA